MDIQNLSAFIAVSEQQSFSKAAEFLFITQPAVSKRISTLESELNVKLFNRLGRHIQLTEAGNALLPSALRILAEIDESKRAIDNLNKKIQGKLKIATSHHIGLHRLPPVLRSFTRDFPDVELDIRFMDSEEACSCVLNGEVELAIATLPDNDSTNNGWQHLQYQVIWHDPLSIVISVDHEDARTPSISIDKLQALPAIMPSKNTFTRRLLEQSLGVNERNLHIAMETNYLETIKMMVSIGLGWSVLPTSMLSDDITQLNVNGIEFERLLGIVRHKQRTLSNPAKMLLIELEKQI